MATASQSSSAGDSRRFDLVLFGATGFVGGLTADELAAVAPAGMRIALAGRNQVKLDVAARRCAANGTAVETLIVDVERPHTTAAMAEAAKVVVSTVGPYTHYGLEVVRACAQAGTDYADLTGEPLFVRESILTFGSDANRSGARIVHSSGFDSVPSDLLVWLLRDAARADHEGSLTETTMVVRRVRGGFSGGTAASGLAHGRAMAADPVARRHAQDPYTHSDRRNEEPELGRQPDGRLVALRTIDDGLRGWAGGFFMGPHNTRVVRRSNTLTDWSYGRRFKYSEVMAVPGGPLSLLPASIMAGGLSMMPLAGLIKYVPELVTDAILPASGSGPNAKSRAKGHFTFETYTRTTTGARYRATFAMTGDPGYAATAVILAQVGLALALDGERLSTFGGVLTPAVALGDALIPRLRAMGVRLDVERLSGSETAAGPAYNKEEEQVIG
ncbi:saccharopine dehydrogenase family protein [Gordonia sp. CPCC 205333]|uniref:saccharopine dehydrogenase family protein n=1 Tax=Gordonia sp. CPCC 205333 TaxID=3140790 RepID=UPI003AF3B7BD